MAAIVYHGDFLQQTQTLGHPECPERLASIMAYLDALPLDLEVLSPGPARPEDVLAVHSQEYIEFLSGFGQGRMDADTYVWPHTYDMAMLAAGGAILAADRILTGGGPVHALLRPPGHHATALHGGGFCYINNIAVAAERLLKKLDRVAIVDIDVHHGNGTNDIFLARDDVLYISTHQWGIYPGTGPAEQVGEDAGEGFTVNIPLGSRVGDATFALAAAKIILPILKQYEPDALLVSLGVDAHYMDPLASLTLSSCGYLDVMASLQKTAEECCGSRLAVFLEGGYNLHALAEVVGGAISHSQGVEPQLQYDDVFDTEALGVEWLERVRNVQSHYWHL
jgi:acetoin utilization deacetylase AcuC-like enzyme